MVANIIVFIVFVLVLGLLVFVHELGHFIAAKRNGIKVEEFAFGFPPRIFAVKRGETEYALNLLPFGGYVRMLGESDDDSTAEKHNSRSYAAQSPWSRAKVVVAGVIMNFVLAWVLISVGYMVGMPPIVTEGSKIPRATVTTSVVVAGVMKDSAADKMGVKPSDAVVKIDGVEIKTKEALSQAAKDRKGQTVAVEVIRDNKPVTLTGELSKIDPALGVQLSDDSRVKLPIWWAPVYAVWEALKAVGAIFVGVFDFFKQILGTRHIPAEAAGPVGIYYITRSVLELGFGALLSFMAILSINLGVINILPIPALDGGRLLFIILESINKGKKVVNAQIENIAHNIGFILLILLIITITYHDILRIGR